jgi:hypothetical protein
MEQNVLLPCSQKPPPICILSWMILSQLTRDLDYLFISVLILSSYLHVGILTNLFPSKLWTNTTPIFHTRAKHSTHLSFSVWAVSERNTRYQATCLRLPVATWSCSAPVLNSLNLSSCYLTDQFAPPHWTGSSTVQLFTSLVFAAGFNRLSGAASNIRSCREFRQLFIDLYGQSC